MNEIKEDLREIKKEIKTIHETVIKNTVSLDHHMARTSANEKRIRQVEVWLIGMLGSGLVGLCGIVFKKLM